MKILKPIIFLLAFVVLSSCTKNINFPPDYNYGKTTPTPTNTNANASMTAVIDGQSVNFNTTSANLINSPLGKTMTIVGVNGSQIISLAIYDLNGVGVYDFEKTFAQASYNQDQSSSGSFASETGKITITTFTDTSIKGTFEFVAPNQDYKINTKRTITEGKFDLTYKKVN